MARLYPRIPHFKYGREYVNTVQAENSEVQTKVLEKYFHL